MENEAPDVDLNGAAAGNDTGLTYAENDPLTLIAPDATVTDGDSPDFEGGSLTVMFTAGGTADDQLAIANQGFGPGQFLVDENNLYYGGTPVGTISGGNDGSTPLVVTFFASMTPAIAQALIRSIGYVNFSQDPGDADRILTFTLTDGDGGTSVARTATITVSPVDTPADAQDDTVPASENAVATGSLFSDNGGGADTDPDGPPLAVSEVNGSSANVDTEFLLASGARLTVNADGSFSYDPDGQFDYLTDGSSGAVNTFAVETFQYRLAGGDTATVTVIVNGVAGPGDQLMGDGNDNVITGTPGADLFLLQQGGNDNANGLGGNDVFYFGAAFTRRDTVNGGEGRDAVVLQGHYALTLSATNLNGVESLSLQSGANDRWGDTGQNSYDYAIVIDDANVAAGRQLIVNGQSLGEDEDFTFDGSAENDGHFLIFGGHGVDTLDGGDGNDVFVFAGDRWGEGDSVDGHAGRDALIIAGDGGLTHIDFGPVSLHRVESVSVNSRYTGDPEGAPSYEFVLDNLNVAEGDTLIVNGSSLTGPGQTISVDGSAVELGNLALFGGAGDDSLTGGAGADRLHGAGGQDDLAGGGGADIFQYRAAAESTSDDPDGIDDFEPGFDLVDLRLIDANTLAGGDQAFSWIGAEAFGGDGAASAGQLRAYRDGATWFVEGDTNGDGIADLVIVITLPFDAELSQGDFLL